jgi:hypothetical protein
MLVRIKLTQFVLTSRRPLRESSALREIPGSSSLAYLLVSSTPKENRRRLLSLPGKKIDKESRVYSSMVEQGAFNSLVGSSNLPGPI